MNKLDHTLDALLAGPADRATPVGVLVRLVPGASRPALPGLEVAAEYPAIATLAGRLRLGDLAALAADPAVDRIEFDGEMRALGR
jgi:hypothetical protein